MRRTTTVRFAAVALASAAALAGCSGDRDTSEGRKIEAAVKRFALASGPEACSELTPKALKTVYGRGVASPAVAKATCIKASKRFSGQAVSVTFVKFTDATDAHATAKTADGQRYYSVGLAKRHGRWLINAVTPTPRPG